MMKYKDRRHTMNLLQEGIDNGTVIKTKQVVKMTVDGITDNYSVFQVRLENLFYNDQNDRIATWVSQYKAEHGEESLTRENIETYNMKIQDFIEKSNPERLKQTQANIALLGQQKYGVVLNDGRIIDGNRRFTCLRNLSKDSDKYHYFETVILEKDYEHSAKQIKMLELQIQIGEEARVDYDPIDRLVGIYRDIEESKLLTVDEYVRSTGQKKKDVEKDLDVARLLVEFLEAIKAPKQYYLAREMKLDGPLRELFAILKNIKDEDKRQEVKYIVFTNFLMQPQGDMTRFVRKLKGVANSSYIDEFIEKEMDITEDILDGLPDNGTVTSDTIAKVRADEEVREELEKTMDVVSNKVKATETRNKPNQMLTKAVDSIEAIDKQIIRKLNEEQRDDLRENIDRLEELLDEIKEVLNV